MLLLYHLLIYGSYSSTIKLHISVDYVVVTADVDMKAGTRDLFVRAGIRDFGFTALQLLQGLEMWSWNEIKSERKCVRSKIRRK